MLKLYIENQNLLDNDAKNFLESFRQKVNSKIEQLIDSLKSNFESNINRQSQIFNKGFFDRIRDESDPFEEVKIDFEE